jgi:rare lipoprotein A
MQARTWHSGCFRAAVIGTLALSGCTQEQTGGAGESTRGEKATDSVADIGHQEVGEASWYGPGFQGHATANGETFDQHGLTAAHPSLPMGTEAKVTNLDNGKEVDVTINDRGPYAENRVIDLSRGAARKLDMVESGTAQVKIETGPSAATRP